MAGATDLEGNSRTNGVGVDMGCYEYQLGALDCGFVASPLSSFPSAPTTFSASVAGTNTANVHYYWDFTNGGTYTVSGTDRAAVTNFYAAPGAYSVKLMVSNQVAETATYVRTDYLTIGPATTYVARAGNTPAYPYDSWTAAASNVQDAVDAAADGSLVLVGDGHYTLNDTVSIEKAITLQSTGGKTAAVLDGDATVSCLYLDNAAAVVDGFTITNGVSTGARIYRGGTVRNCNIVGNSGSGAAGFYIEGPDGLASHCVVAGNAGATHSTGGGVVYYGTVRNCLVISNTASTGSGSRGGITAGGATVESCTIVRNRSAAGASGGISRYSTATAYLYNCIVASNYVGTTTLTLLNWDGAFSAKNNCTTPTIGTDCITAPPLFADAEYHLDDNSPCIDKGTNQNWMTTGVALDGLKRISGDSVDIGCHEWYPPGGTCVVIK